jgi:hypothetical protein
MLPQVQKRGAHHLVTTSMTMIDGLPVLSLGLPRRPWVCGWDCTHTAGMSLEMATWRSGDAADCKSAYPGSIPGVASKRQVLKGVFPKVPTGFHEMLKVRQWHVRKKCEKRFPDAKRSANAGARFAHAMATSIPR